MTRQSPTPPKGPLAAALLMVVQAVLSVLILLDEIVRPLYRPLARWISQLSLVARAEAAIARLPPYGVLVLLAIPFAVAEPLKIVGLVLVARGQAVPGVVVLVLAYLASFLLVERIYHAGRDALLRIGWFARIMTLLATVRTRLLGWVRASAAGRFVARLRVDVVTWWRGRG